MKCNGTKYMPVGYVCRYVISLWITWKFYKWKEILTLNMFNANFKSSKIPVFVDEFWIRWTNWNVFFQMKRVFIPGNVD